MRIILFLLSASLLIAADAAGRAYAGSADNIPHSRIKEPFEISVLDGNFKKIILGTAKINALERYAVIKEMDSGKRFLYGKEGWLNEDLEIVEIFDRFLVLRRAIDKRYVDMVSG